MKMRKEEAQEALNRSLSGLQEDPWLAQRVIASEKEEYKVKKLSGAALVLVVILGISMATALAAGVTGIWKNVNWFGEVVQDEDVHVASTPVPSEPVETPAADVEQIAIESINNAEARELVVISTENSVSYADRLQGVSSMEEFAALMELSPEFPLPQQIPDGYTFADGQVAFGCLSEGDYILTSQKSIGDGVTESHYVVDEAYDCILGYHLHFTGKNWEDTIDISVRMQPGSGDNDGVIGVADDQTAKTVQVDGMDNSVAIDSDAIHFLFMRKIMAEPVTTLVFGAQENWTETLEEYHTRISSENLSADDLVIIFSK